MAGQYPPIEPFETGMLDTGDGHKVYWEASGNPNGKPALFLHGGPGSGCSENQRRFFDPERYRIVLFDQRGSGRSRPLASEPDADLSTNTTQHLIADIEKLRELNGADRWTILGVSWGSTLALAYAETHPEHVNAIVLGFVTSTSRAEVEWITQGVSRIFPEEWERFTDAIPRHLKHLRPVDAYAQMLFDPDPAECDRAARAWCTWEDVHISLTPGHQPSPRYEDPEFRLRFARLVTHYWSHDAFFGPDQLIREVSKLNGIPGVLINGRYDVSGPLITAWQLHKGWSTSELHVLDDAGHGGGTSFVDVSVGALDHWARV